MNSIELKMKLMEIAAERAAEDFKFATAGGSTMGFTTGQLEMVRSALLAYAANGAREAFNYLKNHDYLKP